MSFQSEYKITAADRQDKGVTGLPDTPNMPTTVIQERFDSLGNLAIDKFNALVDGASDSVDGSDTKFPTNKAIVDYISGEGGAIIDDNTPSTHKTYSSSKVENMYAAIPGNLINDTTPSSSTVYSGNKIENMFANVSDRIIDDSTPSSSKTYSSEEIEQKIADIPTPESFIDDDNVSTETTFSSRKISDNYIGFAETEEQTATDEFSTINGGLLSECKVALSPNQDLHGYDSPWVGGAGKNKLPNTVTSTTINGVTFTVHSDGTVTVNGTATNITAVAYEIIALNGTYILNGCPSGGGSGTYELQAFTTVANRDYGDGVTFTINGDCLVQILIRQGTTLNNAVFKPMIRLATETDPTFAPYTNICPISGHTEASVQNVGVNLIENNTFSGVGAFIQSTVFPVTGAYIHRNVTFSGSGAFTFKLFGIKNGVETVIDQAGYGVSFNDIRNDVSQYDYIRVSGYSNNESNSLTNIMVAFSDTDTPLAYEPYNGYQITVNLGGTYYSGTLDVVSGVFVATNKLVKGNTIVFIDNTVADGQRFRSTNTISDAKVGQFTTAELLCSIFATNRAGISFDTAEGICIFTNGYMYIRTPSVTTLEDFNALIANADICYTLATPLTIQLTPQQVKALVGENHLSAPLDGQEITESKYRYLFTWDIVEDELNKLSDSIDEVSDDLSDRIDDVEETLNKTHYSSAVSCAIDDTTCTIADANITTSSLIEPFYSNTSGDNVVIKNQTVTTGQVVLTFDALLEATSFKVRITNL